MQFIMNWSSLGCKSAMADNRLSITGISELQFIKAEYADKRCLAAYQSLLIFASQGRRSGIRGYLIPPGKGRFGARFPVPFISLFALHVTQWNVQVLQLAHAVDLPNKTIKQNQSWSTAFWFVLSFAVLKVQCLLVYRQKGI